MDTKRCSKCGQVKLLNDFHKSVNTKDGHHTICKECRIKQEWVKYPHRAKTSYIVRRKEQQELLKEGEKRCCRCKEIKPIAEFWKGYSACWDCSRKRYREAQRKWRKTPTGKESGYKRHLKYSKTEKGKLSSQRRGKRRYIKDRKNPKKVLDDAISCLIYQSLRANKKGRRWEKLVDYTLEDLMKHLETQFDDKMNWDNYGSYWWIDHIKPRSLFNYTVPEDPEFKGCWSLQNLQPLEKIENIKKGKKYKE